jgi:hypothetical protein
VCIAECGKLTYRASDAIEFLKARKPAARPSGSTSSPASSSPSDASDVKGMADSKADSKSEAAPSASAVVDRLTAAGAAASNGEVSGAALARVVLGHLYRLSQPFAPKQQSPAAGGNSKQVLETPELYEPLALDVKAHTLLALLPLVQWAAVPYFDASVGAGSELIERLDVLQAAVQLLKVCSTHIAPSAALSRSHLLLHAPKHASSSPNACLRCVLLRLTCTTPLWPNSLRPLWVCRTVI